MEASSESPLFQSLEFTPTPWTRWAGSLVLHSGLVVVLIAIPVTVQRIMQPPDRTNSISLVIPPPVLPKPIPKPVIAPPVVPPPILKPVPKIVFKAPPVKPPEVRTVVVPAPPMDIPKPVEALRVDTPKIDLPARPVIKQEVFNADNIAPVTPQAPVKSVKTGGFGDPNGVQPSTAPASKALTVQAIGAFDAPAGAGQGAANSGKAAGGRKVVASAGFGEAGAGGTGAGGTGHAQVRGAGFGDYDASPRTPSSASAAARALPTETPVEIIFKPKPQYTVDARQKKIEGEVQLEVQFSATGQVHVLRLVRGLGFGLDENARAAASQIRFRPGTRNGSPVDVTGIVHIVFELS
jgi:TonB family protein